MGLEVWLVGDWKFCWVCVYPLVRFCFCKSMEVFFVGVWDLDAYKKAMALSDEVSGLVERLPKKERYDLIDQMSRCATSVPSNISEEKDTRIDLIALGCFQA